MQLRRYFKYQYVKMIRLKDTPSKVAQGIGLGLAMDFAVPIPLLSIFVAFVVAKLLKFNSFAAVMSAVALKPFFIFIVAINVYVQELLVSAVPFLGRMILPHPVGIGYMEQIINSIVSRGVPYLLACWLNAFIVFVISYFAVYYTLKIRIRKIKHKKAKKV